ncbi:MAG: hypothetical protein GYB68_18990 [Chloroflexi bacterium]|nr:hypothetical protein [Chloroflexota bacterium]
MKHVLKHHQRWAPAALLALLAALACGLPGRIADEPFPTPTLFDLPDAPDLDELLTPEAPDSSGMGQLDSDDPAGQPVDPGPAPEATLPPFIDEGVLVDLAETIVPIRDRYELADRFLAVDLEALPDPVPVDYEVGDVTDFWVNNSDNDETLSVPAELVYAGDHIYMWIETGRDFDRAAYIEQARVFDEEIYPLTRSYFGSEPSPGIDGDPRVHVLNATSMGSFVAGYFFSPSMYPEAIVPFSNEKEIFFIHLLNLPATDPDYGSVLAHEFQHMIHWAVDRNETSWVNEGMSELAAFLNGYGPSQFSSTYLINPDRQLTSWPGGGSSGPNYGSSYLIAAYFLDRFGEDAVRNWVAQESNGMQSLDETLVDIGAGQNADQFFSDWLVANLLNDPGVADGRYSYETGGVFLSPGVAETHLNYPAEVLQASVSQYGVDYIALGGGPARLEISFDGQDSVSLIPTSTLNTDGDQTTEDRYVWWSNRADSSNPRLVQTFDLSDLESATLAFDLWFNIEALWDFGYVTISTDGGESWDILDTPFTTRDNPYGNSYGPGYTGLSRDFPGANGRGWLRESLDLSAYTGGEVIISFELLTDDAVVEPGFAIDNISIPEIGYSSDLESDGGGWQSEGFVRVDNVLPQRFSLQVVRVGNGETTVEAISLDELNQATFEVELASQQSFLIITGLTRYTTESASYSYSINQLD